jgi:dGTPase
MWRVKTIGVMVPSAIDAFVNNYGSIMRGSFDDELIGASRAKNLRKCLKDFAKKNIYNHRQVQEEELKGHKTIHGLMDIFWAAIKDRKDTDSISSKRPPLSSYVYSRISENYRRVAESERNSMPLRYKELQLITDMISGMTDTFAISLLKDLRKRGAA